MGARYRNGSVVLAMFLMGCGGGGGGSGSDSAATPQPAASSSQTAAVSSGSARTATEAVTDAIEALLSRSSRGAAASRTVSVSCPEGGDAVTDADVAVDIGTSPRTYTFTADTVLSECNGYTGELSTTGGGELSSAERTISFRTTGAVSGECEVDVADLQVEASRLTSEPKPTGIVNGTLLVSCRGVSSTCTLTDVPLGEIEGNVVCTQNRS